MADREIFRLENGVEITPSLASKILHSFFQGQRTGGRLRKIPHEPNNPHCRCADCRVARGWYQRKAAQRRYLPGYGPTAESSRGEAMT